MDNYPVIPRHTVKHNVRLSGYAPGSLNLEKPNVSVGRNASPASSLVQVFCGTADICTVLGRELGLFVKGLNSDDERQVHALRPRASASVLSFRSYTQATTPDCVTTRA